MTFRKSARWPIVSVRLTSCILWQPIRVEIGMREHRQQDSLDFHPFSLFLCLYDNACNSQAHIFGVPFLSGGRVLTVFQSQVQIVSLRSIFFCCKITNLVKNKPLIKHLLSTVVVCCRLLSGIVLDLRGVYVSRRNRRFDVVNYGNHGKPAGRRFFFASRHCEERSNPENSL